MKWIVPCVLACALVACDDAGSPAAEDASADAVDAADAADAAVPDSGEDDVSPVDFFAGAPEADPATLSVVTWTPSVCPSGDDANAFGVVNDGGDWVSAGSLVDFTPLGPIGTKIYQPGGLPEGEDNSSRWVTDEIEPGECIGGTFYFVDPSGDVLGFGRVIMFRSAR